MQDSIDESPLTRRVRLDADISGLLPGHRMHVKVAGVDAFALRVLYEVTPPLEHHDLARNAWLLLGRDDLGNEYDDGGGAYGLAPDGSRTEGIRSLLPLPAPSVSWLDLSFYAPGESPPNAPRHTLRLHLPPAAYSAQRLERRSSIAVSSGLPL